jgi:hypothetical protein
MVMFWEMFHLSISISFSVSQGYGKVSQGGMENDTIPPISGKYCYRLCLYDTLLLDFLRLVFVFIFFERTILFALSAFMNSLIASSSSLVNGLESTTKSTLSGSFLSAIIRSFKSIYS